MSPVAPEFILLKASAGSGKTHALTKRYLKLALAAPSDGSAGHEMESGGLGAILAITFTKNAAGEMKARILDWLKEAYFGDAKRIADLQEIVASSAAALPRLCGRAIDRILDEYADFQVETIDSFMASVFKASAVDLGFPPDFEIVLEHGELIDYAFHRHLRSVRSGSPEAADFDAILDYLLLYKGETSTFAWNPTADILAKLTDFYARLTARETDPVIEDRSSALAAAVARIAAAAEKLEREIEGSGLERNLRGHCFSRILPAIRERRWSDLVGPSFKTLPVKRPPRAKAAAGEAAVTAVERTWAGLEKAVRAYTSLYARDFFTPYLRAYRSLAGTLDRVKRTQGVVFLEDMYRQLAGYIRAGIIPDIYFRLGERVRHFLIDEFQDTSPMQWLNLRPLVEESLSQGGSLFIVGDTKQAIFGFRDADFRIMRSLERKEDRFGSAPDPRIEELPLNYRSGEALVSFVKGVFRDVGEEYREAAALSGLAGFHQKPSPHNENAGYVEYVRLDKKGAGTSGGGPDEAAAESAGASAGEAEPEENPAPSRVQALVRRLHGRGYAYSDIAVLTYKNEAVAEISSWLNEIDVPFIPFSSLDIRRRPVVREALAVLQFLDSPPDDLAFATVLLGEAFERAAGGHFPIEERRRFLFDCRRTGRSPVYPAFRERRPDLWARLFEPLFQAVGYYPLYDLATAVYRAFDLFARFPGEEAALVRLLEAIKSFEGQGRNDLREFLEFSGGEGTADWTIDVPETIDAVKVMTIHKAKGLGFPAVILLLYGESWQAPDFFLDAGEEGAAGAEPAASEPAGVSVLKINKDMAEADPDLKRVYDETRRRDLVNRLNTLYVALTRAESELFIVGVKGARDKFPFDLLGEEFRSSSVEPPPRRPDRPAAGSPAPLVRISRAVDVSADSGDGLNEERRRRGEFAHRIMAEIECASADDWPAVTAAAASRVDPRFRAGAGEAPDSDSAGLAEAIAGFFAQPPAAAFFEARPGRRILRETTFCDASGRSLRMDRVVVDPDAVHVIDFKTGREPGLGDRDQVLAYTAIVREVFPGLPVHGVLAYIDRGVWEPVA
ncbi:MAG: UvrD-helicase domain-containing protein [Acidobacteriota bacterium]|nr:UvrD-helicase domain-containing protein [Acidobacteriota bacterium]